MRSLGLLIVLIALALGTYLVAKDYVSISGGGKGKLVPLVTAKDSAKKAQDSLKKNESAIQQAIGSD